MGIWRWWSRPQAERVAWQNLPAASVVRRVANLPRFLPKNANAANVAARRSSRPDGYLVYLGEAVGQERSQEKFAGSKYSELHGKSA